MPEYEVKCPTRGVQVYIVEAASKADAARKVAERWKHRTGVEPIEFDTTWVGKPSSIVRTDVRVD